ncbi:DIP1984 family protein [Deinococcus multiflagellatus]|uniref:DIP1984 family protein n=1 Tax=Deinococcus multiflagellatus TaxID=1656887 RepID=A0ABW1ZKU3_9DEIO|nr:DIP1984 family protein [Deinococcus multiflagellatus]MBZ9712538.1 DIP1984 family protein [Deinococcus multiflagellatus]
MKLAEALIERADLQKRAAQLEERLVRNMLVQEGEEPSESPQALLEEFDRVVGALNTLLPRIHRANLSATLPGGETLTDALTRRDLLDLRLKALRRAALTASERPTRYSTSEVRILPTLPARVLQTQVDALAKARRELEAQIQQTNWLTDLPA